MLVQHLKSAVRVHRVVALHPRLVSKKNAKKVYGYNCEAHEFTRTRTTETRNKDHEDHIAGGFNSVSNSHLVHQQTLSCAPGNENSGCEDRS